MPFSCHPLLQFLAHLKKWHSSLQQLDCLCSPGISCLPGLSASHSKVAEVTNINSLSPLQSFRHGVKHSIDGECNIRSTIIWKLRLYLCDQFSFRHNLLLVNIICPCQSCFLIFPFRNQCREAVFKQNIPIRFFLA